MFAFRPSNPYLGFQRPIPAQVAAPQIPPQGQVLQQPGIPPQVGIGQVQPQLSPQLLAQLAQLHGIGLGGFQPTQQPQFGRPDIQPLTSGAYSLR